ncbi:bifunctional precorrin-2 dehydrogenase/sirohydrochlorin ferrochelatase [Shewanella sp. D64]|uniref:precorrin-2 dehydrogenase/sirohydrochlorin ferrochelatase family protein n=1 Tax=unclassified Shewanella TaxID=196818 RepID=UPI0022BA3C2C|nr:MULTISPECIES: bifunctional precorrin-2 dehydrogenase/sirohydrochlorin ferrochelatase [unclassified Shewanella]MEC4725970.1 bifunctional precorrin-2 dehydrogenase/sirohydrochlorin ferrochelatase [Shewanella sp. D64]MEC4737225.1 bifunctional precorrin-2 dehydrogenase/sirohydrochlorin ferrochelatase [Shewanella sp. E94]WBJ93604.1 bifunctional precorrin-2 dehydrogenase/sirohydrochlorin ferrochelatase [Shewanella sp. MTB7]
MQYFPLFVDTTQLKILLIGAGEVASRKLELLARTEASICVIAVDISSEVQTYADNKRISLVQRTVVDEDIIGVDLVYLATANNELNTRLAHLATKTGIWVNVVDNPGLCRFITPSIVDRGRLQIAISTAGAAPVFARELRSRLESWLPHSLTNLFDFVAERRKEVQDKLPIFKQRKLFWEHFFRANGDKFDERTALYYEDSFQHLVTEGEMLLIDDNTPIAMLPIAAMSLMQKLDHVFANEELPLALNELVRRDATRSPLLATNELSLLLKAGKRNLVYADADKIAQLKAHFPMAKHLKPGSL